MNFSQAAAPFVASSDYVIASLPIGTTSRDPDGTSDGAGSHEGPVDFSARVTDLKQLGVNAVHVAPTSLSNLTQTDVEALLNTLTDQGVDRFGMGRDLTEALKPLPVEIPSALGGGELTFYGSHPRARNTADDSTLLAGDDHAGLAPLSLTELPRPRVNSTRPDAFHVAMPSWRTGPAWRSDLQYSLVHQMLNKDFDLVLGTGTPRLQEIHRKRERWVVYGIGDSPSSAVETAETSGDIAEPPPFSLWAMLEVHGGEPSRRISLKLYPVRTQSNSLNDAVSPGPVSEDEFDTIVSALSQRPIRPWRFNNPAMSTGSDELGRHITLDLGEWAAGQHPSRLDALTPVGDPNESILQIPSAALEDAAISLNRPSGAMILPLGAQSAGADVVWLAESTAVIDTGAKRFLTNGPTAHESDVGSKIVGDKALTAEFLKEHGVSTPRTEVVRSVQEAVDAAQTIAGPVVIKPLMGNQGRGVSTDLVSDDDVREGFEFARQDSDEIIIQEHVEVDQEMRVMASPDEVVAVNVRVFPHVVGDGTSTIEQLIRDKNFQRARNTIFKRGAVPLDGVTHRYLERQGISLDDVPALGHTVTVRNSGGNSMGADLKQDLDNTSQEIKDTARQAIAAIPGLGWGGVDIITDVKTGKAFVIEINTNAGFLSAAFPTYGQPRDVTHDIYRLRYEDTAPQPDRDAPIQTPEVTTQPVPLLAGLGSETRRQRPNIGHLLHDSWLRQGFSVNKVTNRLSMVEAQAGERLWVTAHGRTAADRYVLRRFMRYHSMVLQLLERESVPVIRSRAITSTNSLVRFVQGRTNHVVLLPKRSEWDRDGAQPLTEQEALNLQALPFPETWVQTRPPGRYLRVLATPETAWLITEGAPRGPLSANEVAEISRLAVRAVRALPELRWAAVDIIFRRRRLTEGRPDPLLVEGMTPTPQYSLNDHIMAGGLDGFCRHILE